MPWTNKLPKKPHVCKLPQVPSTLKRQLGDEWWCRKCKSRWILTYKGREFLTPPTAGVLGVGFASLNRVAAEWEKL